MSMNRVQIEQKLGDQRDWVVSAIRRSPERSFVVGIALGALLMSTKGVLIPILGTAAGLTFVLWALAEKDSGSRRAQSADRRRPNNEVHATVVNVGPVSSIEAGAEASRSGIVSGDVLAQNLVTEDTEEKSPTAAARQQPVATASEKLAVSDRYQPPKPMKKTPVEVVLTDSNGGVSVESGQQQLAALQSDTELPRAKKLKSAGPNKATRGDSGGAPKKRKSSGTERSKKRQ